MGDVKICAICRADIGTHSDPLPFGTANVLRYAHRHCWEASCAATSDEPRLGRLQSLPVPNSDEPRSGIGGILCDVCKTRHRLHGPCPSDEPRERHPECCAHYCCGKTGAPCYVDSISKPTDEPREDYPAYSKRWRLATTDELAKFAHSFSPARVLALPESVPSFFDNPTEPGIHLLILDEPRERTKRIRAVPIPEGMDADALYPIFAAVFAEVALIQSRGKGKMLSDMTEVERRTFDIANAITQLLRLSMEGA